MAQIIKQPKTQIRVVPKEGEIEITLNINITLDGQVTATAVGGKVVVEEEKNADPLIPDFFSGSKLKFGK